MKKLISASAIAMTLIFSSATHAGFVIIKNGQVKSSSSFHENSKVYTPKKSEKPKAKASDKTIEFKSDSQIDYEYQQFMKERSKHK